MKKPAIALVAAIALIGTAHAVDNPPVKEGFWNVHTVTVDNPGNKVNEGKYSMCRSHAFDSYLEEMKKIPGCTIKADSIQGKAHNVEMSCNVAGTTIATKSTITYSSDSAIHGETNATYTPLFHGMASEKMTMDFTYAGSCPAGIQPGDRVNQDGSVMHLWRHHAPPS